MPPILFLVIPFAVLALCALSDVRAFKIPNRYVAVLLAAWPLTVVLAGTPLETIALSAAIGGAALLIGFGFFALGAFGAGDAKLIAAAILWVPPAQVPAFLVLTAMLGGGLSFLLLVVRRFPLPAPAHRAGWLVQLHGRKRAVPYGVAIAGGAMLAIARGFGA